MHEIEYASYIFLQFKRIFSLLDMSYQDLGNYKINNKWLEKWMLKEKGKYKVKPIQRMVDSDIKYLDQIIVGEGGVN